MSLQTIAGTNLVVIVYQSFIILEAGLNYLLGVSFSIVSEIGLCRRTQCD